MDRTINLSYSIYNVTQIKNLSKGEANFISEEGNISIVIEHNLDVVKRMDYVIDTCNTW